MTHWKVSFMRGNDLLYKIYDARDIDELAELLRFFPDPVIEITRISLPAP